MHEVIQFKWSQTCVGYSVNAIFCPIGACVLAKKKINKYRAFVRIKLYHIKGFAQSLAINESLAICEQFIV